MVSVSGRSRLDDAATGALTSTINEPSVAASSSSLLVTGNWYASWSADGGSSWTFLDPFTLFPATPGGFCCDQLATYVPRLGLWVWLLQYAEDSRGENVLRLAVSRQGGAGPWRWWDVAPTDLSGSWSGQWFDYPDLAVSDEHLWISVNLFAGRRWTRAVVIRYPLTQLSSARPVQRRHWSTTSAGSLRFTQGAQQTMWFASTLAFRSAVRLFRWDDTSERVQTWEISATGWNARDYDSLCPDGTPWLKRMDDRITAGWRSRGQLGFLWTAGRSAGRPHPFVRGVVLDEGSLDVVREPDLWSPTGAWAYPNASPNRPGDVGIAAYYGGPSAFPTFAVGAYDDEDNRWLTQAIATSTHSPPNESWGDYLTIRPHIRRWTSWVAVGATLQGGADRRHVEPEVVEFRV